MKRSSDMALCSRHALVKLRAPTVRIGQKEPPADWKIMPSPGR